MREDRRALIAEALRAEQDRLKIEELRAEIVRCAMAYTFGDYPSTDDLPTKGDALAKLEATCIELEQLEGRRT